jgi:hypothetical protein
MWLTSLAVAQSRDPLKVSVNFTFCRWVGLYTKIKDNIFYGYVHSGTWCNKLWKVHSFLNKKAKKSEMFKVVKNVFGNVRVLKSNTAKFPVSLYAYHENIPHSSYSTRFTITPSGHEFCHVTDVHIINCVWEDVLFSLAIVSYALLQLTRP